MLMVLPGNGNPANLATRAPSKKGITMRDFRDGIRFLLRRPGHSAAVALTLGLGIGVNALVFSAVHAVLLEPLPFTDPFRLVNVWQTQPGNDTRRVAPANFLDWRSASSFDALAAYAWRSRSLAGDEPERIVVASVSTNLFSVLGVAPMAGHGFLKPTDGGLRQVILREDLWRRRFGADPSIVGRTIRLDDEPLVVSGIVETRLGFPDDAQAWTEARYDIPELSAAVTGDIRTVRDARYLRVLGRLRQGVTRPQAQAEMDAVAQRLRGLYPDANADTGVNVVDLHDQLTGGSARTLWILFAVVGAVLAVACGNVATLLIAGAVSRRQELRLRAALGASRLRLVRQLLTESLLLALAGASLGMFLAWALQPALIASLPSATPRLGSLSLNVTVIWYSLGVALMTTALFGLVPGMLAASGAELSRLRDGGRSGTSRRGGALASTLMAAQLAIALVLLTGTGLMLRTLWTLYHRDPGIDVERLLALDVTIPDARSRGRSAAVGDLRRMTARIAQLPGVTAVGAIQSLPLAARGASSNIRVEGRVFAANEAPDVVWRTVTPDYFRTVGSPVVRGRAFTEADHEGSTPVAIINSTLAQLLWGDSDPVGKRIGTGLDGDGAGVAIVGVVTDVPQEGISARVLPEMFRPLDQRTRFSADAMSIVVRTESDPVRLATAARAAVREVHPQAPVSAIRPMSTVVAAGVAREVTAARGLALFGALALILAAVGIHGVTARLVNNRKRELGVRMALGAAPSRLRSMVLGRTLRIATVGLIAGTILSAFLSRQLGSLLHGTEPVDPLVMIPAAAILLLSALAAAYGPARSAARTDPLIIMRSDSS